jgi:hypothetical protein
MAYGRFLLPPTIKPAACVYKYMTPERREESKIGLAQIRDVVDP